MGEDGKLFKTKICVLYRKGHCPRRNCNFAHGQADLRRFDTSFTGRRDYGGGDLRDKLERRHSPLRRYSPRRDGRGQQAFRGYNPSHSVEERSSDRKRPKTLHHDGESDRSETVKVFDRLDDRIGNRQLMSRDPETVMGKQLRLAREEMDTLLDYKYELKHCLEDRVREVDSLTYKVQELEDQVLQEKEECERITSKIKKFVTAHKRHSRLQDELKRSYDQLQKMGDQLSSDASRPGLNEENSVTNMLTDEETNAILMKGGEKETIRMEKHSRWSGKLAEFDLNKEADQRENGSAYQKSPVGRSKLNVALASPASDKKLKRHEPGFGLPLTSMAAHEGIETAEMAEDDPQVTETTSKSYDDRVQNVGPVEDDMADVDIV